MATFKSKVRMTIMAATPRAATTASPGEAHPQLDTGRIYTNTSTGASDTRVHSREDSVWDSPLWGDKYTTKYNYDFLYW